jgi:hypothetical protein
MGGNLGSKSITFVAVMAALGNVLSFISIRLAPIVPNISMGFTSFSLALDLSHLATFTAAFFGGPLIGGLTGMIGGLVAAFEFGFSKGNLLTGFGLPMGKALTGLTAGFLTLRMGVERDRVRMVLYTVFSYVPEGIWTIIIFLLLFPFFIPFSSFWVKAFTIQVLVKAFIEMVVMGLILAGMLANQGFTEYVRGFFS